MSSRYRLIFSSDAEKAIGKLDKTMIKRILSALEDLSEDPYSHPNTKKMNGSEKDIYRLRVGSYRIIYEIISNELIIFVVRILPRGDIYK
ncbi:type II toxin-antitoxin system RelE family toxin [Paenibacillus jiagnxiensis]|uniref:type II toxin-antitoxin system RelE family toxin n=1 Tax=Paenibacillus jiagnxiensis TaxID=3228926 RepID=UPI0033A33488